MKSLAIASILTLTLWAPLAAQPPGSAEENQARLDDSASWGIELESGKIAIDPTLVVYADGRNRTVVINPRYAQQAAEQLGAKLLPDGSFGFDDGSTIQPLVAQYAIRVGNEPEDLLAEAGLPTVDFARVRLMAPTSTEESATEDQASREKGTKAVYGELRLRFRHRCEGCTSCDKPCDKGVVAQGPRHRSCQRTSWFWNLCLEVYAPLCFQTHFYCNDCKPPITGVSVALGWTCGPC